MPERLNFIMLLEVSNDGAIREALIRDVERVFDKWVGDLTTIYPLNYADPQSEVVVLQRSDAIRYSLGASDLLLVYFESKLGDGTVVLSISKQGLESITYGISLPTTELIEEQSEMGRLLLALLASATAQGVSGAVVAGNELELDDKVGSVGDLIKSASDRVSLIEYVCTTRRSLVGLVGFVALFDECDMVVSRRVRAN